MSIDSTFKEERMYDTLKELVRSYNILEEKCNQLFYFLTETPNDYSAGTVLGITTEGKVNASTISELNELLAELPVDSKFVLLDAVQTVTNKRWIPKKYSATSVETLTPEISTYNYYELTNQTDDLYIANHSTSTPLGGEMFIVSITCGNADKEIVYGGNYVARGGMEDELDGGLPAHLYANKVTTLGFMYIAGLAKFNLVAYGQEEE